MAEHLTEEEQVESLKRWWNENWLSIVLPIVLALGGYGGWNAWQNHQVGQAQAASDQYQALTRAAETQPGIAMSAEQQETVGGLAETLIADHDGTLYADMAKLMLARVLVESKELEAAQGYLQQVSSEGANASMQQLAKARLARVLSAKGETEKALSLVAQAQDESYQALFAEVRGDIYLSQGKAPAANTAYSAALELLPPSEFNRRSLIQLKLDSVALPEEIVPTGTDLAPEIEAAVEGDV